MADLTIIPAGARNGDNLFSVQLEGKGIGMVRENPRTGDWHAVKGEKSRYFGTRKGAANWILRLHRNAMAKRAAN